MLRVELANIEDAGIITEIKVAAYNKEIFTYLGRKGGPPGYDNVESEIYIIKKFIAYKIILKDKIIGALFLIPVNNTTMRFEDFVIKPEYQGNGYGYKTMEIIEEKHNDIFEWQLSTPVFSVGNQYLYKKFGYTEVSRDKDEINYRKRITR